MENKTRYRGYLALFIGLSILTISNASAYEYSVTTIEEYTVLDDIDPWGDYEYARVEYWLHDVAGWNEEFYESEYNVDETDFGTSNSGYEGLDEADFHFHLGHGVDDGGTELALRNWLPWTNIKDVRAQDVADKWDADNEWVFLHSCHILDDEDDWADALKYSHGIMGFVTETTTSTSLIDRFFSNAINDNDKITTAYYDATKDTYGSDVTAAIITDTLDQWNTDHLHSEGSMASDESPDDSSYIFLSWTC
ncbi:MAG: hypothetical protein PWQ51_1707 [Methanolobus sp.]|jgi:hypothetical protein|nr:hypothetical protein [Methanolobus sp.]